MSGQYFIVPDEGRGGRWNFTEEQLAQLASEIRPGSEISGPYGENDIYQIDIPAGGARTHEVIYQAKTMGFSFRTGEIRLTGGLVFQILRQLAPDIPALWIASFDGTPYPFRVAGRTEYDFIQELQSL